MGGGKHHGGLGVVHVPTGMLKAVLLAGGSSLGVFGRFMDHLRRGAQVAMLVQVPGHGGDSGDGRVLNQTMMVHGDGMGPGSRWVGGSVTMEEVKRSRESKKNNPENDNKGCQFKLTEKRLRCSDEQFLRVRLETGATGAFEARE